MQLEFRWTKDETGALDLHFVQPLARHFGLTAFIETGTYRGDTLASMSAAFARLLSIELAPDLASQARARFADLHKVTIIQADSATGLQSAFAAAPDQPALIWLDAHYSGGETARSGNGNTPVQAELDRILSLRDGRDVILIDDARYFWPIPNGFSDHVSLHGYPLLGDIAERLRTARTPYVPLILGDTLLALPQSRSEDFQVSPVVAACSQSRFRAPCSGVAPAIEQTIRSAESEERRALKEIPQMIEAQREFGLGGHYYYWRAIALESEGCWEDAARDLDFAARCDVIPVDRTTPASAIE